MADERATETEINRLYWESDLPVAEIAERLGVSRRALYDGIRPRPAGAPCPSCGEPLGFRNRRSAESREAECAACGTEERIPDPGEEGAAAETDGRSTRAPAGSGARTSGETPPARRMPAGATSAPHGSGPVLGAVMVAGLAVGAALGWAVRRR